MPESVSSLIWDNALLRNQLSAAITALSFYAAQENGEIAAEALNQIQEGKTDLVALAKLIETVKNNEAN